MFTTSLAKLTDWSPRMHAAGKSTGWHNCLEWHFHNIYLNFKHAYLLTQQFHF